MLPSLNCMELLMNIYHATDLVSSVVFHIILLLTRLAMAMVVLGGQK